MTIAVTLIDAGTGNLHSVQKALEAAGAAVERTRDPQAVRAGNRLVLPGVGAFGDFMTGLRQSGLDQAVLEAATAGRPLLGICVGMQALFDRGQERGSYPGLGLLPGNVVHFPPLPNLKVPHTGWNQLEPAPPANWLELDPQAYAYFNHSYYCQPENMSDCLLQTHYGLPFASAVQRGPLMGVQFHPEKSQKTGLHLLKRFLTL